MKLNKLYLGLVFLIVVPSLSFADETETVNERLLGQVERNASPQKINATLNIAGASVDAQNAEGDTPLIIATRNGNVALVRLLLEKGANKQIENNQEETAYQVALGMHNNALTKLLMPEGSNFGTTKPRRRSFEKTLQELEEDPELEGKIHRVKTSGSLSSD